MAVLLRDIEGTECVVQVYGAVLTGSHVGSLSPHLSAGLECASVCLSYGGKGLRKEEGRNGDRSERTRLAEDITLDILDSSPGLATCCCVSLGNVNEPL